MSNIIRRWDSSQQESKNALTIWIIEYLDEDGSVSRTHPHGFESERTAQQWMDYLAEVDVPAECHRIVIDLSDQDKPVYLFGDATAPA